MSIEKKRIAWGITGSGDRLKETINVLERIKEEYESRAEIQVYLSKAAAQVLKYYRLFLELERDFTLRLEVDSNTPFLAGALQLGKFEFLLIAPATSNTTAKISLGIADELLTNSAIMALKALVPVYIMPSDYKEETVVTKLPNGRSLKLKIRKEDVSHTHKLVDMDGVHVLKKPQDIYQVFENHLRKHKTASSVSNNSFSGS